jgi:hypothetical protein
LFASYKSVSQPIYGLIAFFIAIKITVKGLELCGEYCASQFTIAMLFLYHPADAQVACVSFQGGEQLTLVKFSELG